VGVLPQYALDANDYFLGKVVVKQNIFPVADVGGPIGREAKLGYFFSPSGHTPAQRRFAGTYINIPANPGILRPLGDRQSASSWHWTAECPASSGSVQFVERKERISSAPGAGGYL